MQKFSKNSLLFLIVLLVVVSVVALFYKPIKETFQEGNAPKTTAAPITTAAPVTCNLNSQCTILGSTMQDKNKITLYCGKNNNKELVWHDKVGNNYNPHTINPKDKKLKNFTC